MVWLFLQLLNLLCVQSCLCFRIRCELSYDLEDWSKSYLEEGPYQLKLKFGQRKLYKTPILANVSLNRQVLNKCSHILFLIQYYKDQWHEQCIFSVVHLLYTTFIASFPLPPTLTHYLQTNSEFINSDMQAYAFSGFF